AIVRPNLMTSLTGRAHRRSQSKLRAVTSRVVCQGEGGGDSLVEVFVGEDGEQDAVHGGLVLESAHRAGTAADLAEAALDRVGGGGPLGVGGGGGRPHG